MNEEDLLNAHYKKNDKDHIKLLKRIPNRYMQSHIIE